MPATRSAAAGNLLSNTVHMACTLLHNHMLMWNKGANLSHIIVARLVANACVNLPTQLVDPDDVLRTLFVFRSSIPHCTTELTLKKPQRNKERCAQPMHFHVQDTLH
jgi:hypothetical protein